MGSSQSSPSVPRPTATPYCAVVAGSTGATGRWCISEFLRDPSCEKVTAIVRKKPGNLDETWPDCLKDKLEVIEVPDFSQLAGLQGVSLGKSTIIGVCAMGSAPYSEEADFTAPSQFAIFAKAQGISSMALVSSIGVKPGSGWSGYIETLGRRETFFGAEKFPTLLVFRPGFLLRQERVRTKEKFAVLFPDSMKIDTRDLAKVIRDEIVREGLKPDSDSATIKVYEQSDIKTIQRSFPQ